MQCLSLAPDKYEMVNLNDVLQEILFRSKDLAQEFTF